MSDKPRTFEVSANDFIEAQTKAIEREFKCSRPRPRNKAMGFKGSDKPKHSNDLTRPEQTLDGNSTSLIPMKASGRSF